MGYNTDFKGFFSLHPQASAEQVRYLNLFSTTRRMQRNVSELMNLFHGEFGLDGDYGNEGEYFVGKQSFLDMKNDSSVLHFNEPPAGQPSLWCPWTLSDDGSRLISTDADHTYFYVDWLEYLIEHFFNKWGIMLSGEVFWFGEDPLDKGVIRMEQNEVHEEYL